MNAQEFRRRRRIVEKSQNEAGKVIGLSNATICLFEGQKIMLNPNDLWKLDQWLKAEEKKLGISTPASQKAGS